ncbi:DDE-type integrase/transposase/recombinase [Patescibacteria group bacterium]|nr:DDE-type integrase/transposase/recombinase [Patescibacteria group bacterium]
MAYTTNEKLPEVRRKARELLKQGWSTRKVARHLGYTQGAIVKWSHRTTADTLSPVPKKSPRAMSPELRAKIIAKRLEVRRCAIVVHALLKREEVVVSLSSVKRIISTYCAPLKRKSAWAKTRRYPPRPEADHPGALVEMDTVHFFGADGVKRYVYTALDVYSRTGYAMASDKANAVVSTRFFDKTRRYFSFRIETIQTDNGPEFKTWFTDHVKRRGVLHRHNHPRSPNENGHLERFNRTLQEEMPKEGFSMHIPADIPVFCEWYNTERPHMGIDCKTPAEMLKAIPSY